MLKKRNSGAVNYENHYNSNLPFLQQCCTIIAIVSEVLIETTILSPIPFYQHLHPQAINIMVRITHQPIALSKDNYRGRGYN